MKNESLVDVMNNGLREILKIIKLILLYRCLNVLSTFTKSDKNGIAMIVPMEKKIFSSPWITFPCCHG
jgi:hypothetical protein